MEDIEFRRLCTLAGVTANELMEHPEHGTAISASAVRKMAAINPDRVAARIVTDVVAGLVRARWRVIQGGGQESGAGIAPVPCAGP